MTILACVAILSIVGYRFLAPRSDSRQEFPHPGTQLPISKIGGSLGDRSTFIALSPDCPYCMQSTGFYKQLLSGDYPSNRKFFILFDKADSAKADDFINKFELTGLQNEAQYSLVDFKEFGVVATPTIIVTEQSGIVIRTWVGKLRRSQEAEITSLLN